LPLTAGGASQVDTRTPLVNAPTGSQKETAAQPAEDRLTSWKAIAAYVKRDVTTAQRWEKREGMPVHRHLHDKRGSVYAFRGELDAWLKDRSPQLASEQRRRVMPWQIAAAGALVAIGIALGLWLLMRSERPTAELLFNARVVPLTDFEGMEQAAAISRDGRFVAFLSDRDGRLDAWVTQVGSGEFRNLTQGKAPELLNPEVRSVGFTPDGSLVTLWTRVPDSRGGSGAVNLWAVPTTGGALRPYRDGAVEMDWSADGKQSVFHTTAPGDPTFLLSSDPQATARQIHVAPRGVHSHFQVWSPDNAFIYFTQGIPPDEMDLWRMKADGTGAERLTFHNSRVISPAFLDPRMLLYLATTEDGAGPWLYALDVEGRTTRRISFGLEQYTSLAASADGQRLVATIEHAKTSLWRVAISDDIVGESGASRIDLPNVVGGLAPRVGPGYLLYVSPKGTGYGIWKLAGGTATELYSAPRARVVGGASISPDGKRIAFAEESPRGTRLYVMSAEGSGVRRLAESLDVRGTPSWSPDGLSITVGAVSGRDRRLFKVPADGKPPTPILDTYASNPLWSSDGSLLVYSDASVGPTFGVKAVNADGTPHALPPLTLPRASRRISFVPGRHALVVLQGEMRHVNFWYIDLDTGQQRQLTDFGREFAIRDFDVSAEGEIVFDRLRDNSDIVFIELQER
jgi:Tol biopolymer transport system component